MFALDRAALMFALDRAALVPALARVVFAPILSPSSFNDVRAPDLPNPCEAPLPMKPCIAIGCGELFVACAARFAPTPSEAFVQAPAEVPVFAAPDASFDEASTDGSDTAVVSTSNPFHAGERWSGFYVCPQGNTNLVLVIDEVAGNSIQAKFDFEFAPAAVTGSFALSGTWQPSTLRATFTPGAWIARPGPNWYPVGMKGTVDLRRRVYEGSIVSPGCGAFSLVN
jgi:hypothetical protein